MVITEVKENSPEMLHAINTLLPQLSTSAEPLETPELEKIIRSDSVHLLVAQEGNSYLGTLSLVVFPTISGNRAWIEDVVVSENA